MLSRQRPRQGHVRATVVQQELDELLVDAAAAADSPVGAVPRVRNAGATVVIDTFHICVGLENWKRMKTLAPLAT